MMSERDERREHRENETERTHRLGIRMWQQCSLICPPLPTTEEYRTTTLPSARREEANEDEKDVEDDEEGGGEESAALKSRDYQSSFRTEPRRSECSWQQTRPSFTCGALLNRSTLETQQLFHTLSRCVF